MENYNCSICKKDFYGYGNNPYPLCEVNDHKARCCDDCNLKYVLKARMIMIQKEQSEARLKQLKESINKQK
jgi:DNA-directed RNA polymerase subunit RPC12/RpoP